MELYVGNLLTNTIQQQAYALSTDCILSGLEDWHIALIVIGIIVLVFAIPFTITGIVFSSKEAG